MLKNCVHNQKRIFVFSLRAMHIRLSYGCNRYRNFIILPVLLRKSIGIFLIIVVDIFKASVRQCGPVVRALALRSGDPGFKTRSDHSLNLFLVAPGSTSRFHL